MLSLTGQHARSARAQSSSARRNDNYARRRPEETALYQCVAEHWPEFREHLEQRGGLPKFVEEEFQAYLGSGVWRQVASSSSAVRVGTRSWLR